MTEQEEREQFYKDVQKITPMKGVEYWNNGRMVTVTSDCGIMSMDSYEWTKMMQKKMVELASQPMSQEEYDKLIEEIERENKIGGK